MTLKIALCDDQEEETKLIYHMLRQYEMGREVDMEVSVFSSGDAMMQAYKSADTFQIIFLDVEMPGHSGLDIAKQIRRLYGRQVKIVFVSLYPKYMQSSFDVQAFHYLTKPVDSGYLEQLMDRMIDDIKEDVLSKVVISGDGIEYLINIRDILYIETIKKKRDTLCIHSKSHQLIEYCGFLVDWEKELSPHGFAVPCRGFLVNLSEISSIHKTELLLTNGQSVPLSKRHEKEIRSRFSKQIITFP